MVSDKGTATELSINDERRLNESLREMKAVYDEVVTGLSVDEQYGVAAKVVKRFSGPAIAEADRVAASETGTESSRPGAYELAEAQRVAAGAIGENLRDTAEDLTEALVHADRRMVLEAGREMAWAMEDLGGVRAGRPVSAAAFQGNRDADRTYAELWERGRRAT